MGYRFEFDRVNEILLLRVEGLFTDELLAAFYGAAQKYWAAIDPKMGIVDLSSVTELAVSTEFVRQLVNREPVGDATATLRVIVAPTTLLFGLFRMFQILSQRTRPMLIVVHTLEEAYLVLGVRSPRFEPMDRPPTHSTDAII
jgi:hypothetical protein